MIEKTGSTERASTAQGNATADPDTGEFRVYGGDCGLIHVPDGERGAFGADLAVSDKLDTDTLCPGCYMVVGYDMLVHLARVNGQDVRELALTMIHEFGKLLNEPERPLIEHVDVKRFTVAVTDLGSVS